MGIRFQKLINSPLGVGLALGFGRAVPSRLGYPLAGFIADRLSSRREAAIVRAVRANQWVVSGESLSGDQLDCVVRAIFRSHARCLYDLYHNLNNPEAMLRLVALNSLAEEMIERTRAGNRGSAGKSGVVIVGVHLSNFDLVLQSAGLMGLNVQVLSAPEPGSGYRWQNDIRRQHGLEITPASLPALRLAVGRLQAGGSVLTGVDRPLPGRKYQPRFFGRPASLPIHHIYLALKANVPVYVFGAILGPDGTYHVQASEPVSMRMYDDHHQAMLCNAERILEVAEEIIRRAPQQWAMFYPVWPGVIEEMP